MIQTLREMLFSNPRIDPDRTALIVDDSPMTYRELQDAVARVASALARDGVGVGDRVCVLLENIPEYIVSYFAITAIGAIYVPLNWRLHASEHVMLMQNAEPKAAILSAAFGETAAAAQAQVPSLKRVVAVRGALPGCADYAAWCAESAELPADQLPAPDSGAVIVYTSGTTGLPKGVLLTHRSVVVDLHNVAKYAEPMRESVAVHVSPFYHQTFVHVLVHLAFGAAVALVKRFDAGDLLATLARHRATYIFVAPTMLYEMLDHPKLQDFDLSSLQTVVYGAAPITGARLRQAIEFLGSSKLVQAYGLTEATSHVSFLSKEDHLVAEGSIGRGIGEVEVRVVDDAGKACGPGDVGEILVRGATVMHGYWRAPQATSDAIVDGWLHSGDLARIDERGYMYIVDRKKDLVISGGANIYPRDIESVIAEHPGVADVAVFGVPDPYWGEALSAAVVSRHGLELNAAAVQEFCRSRLGGYQVPKNVFVVQELPKNATGKILKRELRKQFAPGG